MDDKPVTAFEIVRGGIVWTVAGAAVTYTGLTMLLMGGYYFMLIAAWRRGP